MNNKPALSARWTHPAHDGDLPVGKLGRADVSSWAHATSKPFGSVFKPRRPEVGVVRNQFQPVRNLKALRTLQVLDAKPHDPSSVVLPFEGSRKQDPCDINKTFKLQKSYWSLLGYKGMDVRPKAT